MTTGREELLPISIFACAEAMESIERFPLNPIEMEAGTDREIEGKSAPMVVCPYNAAITEDEYVYFVVQEGAVREVSQNEYSELVDGQRPNNVRTTGSWSINNSLLEAGKGKYYSQENGDAFEVAAGEYIELEIDTAYHSRTFGVGYTGTAELEEEISLPIFKGARVAFIDALVTPGEYRVLVRNKGDKSEIINGHIYIY